MVADDKAPMGDVTVLAREQCRAARAWLNWGQDELAARSGVSRSCIRDFETGQKHPRGHNLSALQRAFEAAGVRLIENSGRAAGINVQISGRAAVSGTP